MRSNFMVCCEYGSTLRSGAPALVGIFRGINVPALPAALEPFYLAFELEVDPPQADRTYQLELCMMDEDGRTYFDSRLEVDFRRRPDLGPSYCYFCERIQIQRPIEAGGPYRFDLSHEETILASARLDITLCLTS